MVDPIGEGENPPIGVEESKKMVVEAAELKPKDIFVPISMIIPAAETVMEALLKMWGLELKGPDWVRETIEPADLIKALSYKPSLSLAKLKAAFAKTLKGPGWKQSTISFEELKEFMVDSLGLIGFEPKPEYKIRYYLHDYDLVGEVIALSPERKMWATIHWENLSALRLQTIPRSVISEELEVKWDAIDWNGFCIHHNDSPDFTRVERES